MSNEVVKLGLLELSKHLASRTLSPLEVLDAFYAQIEKYNNTLNAFCTLDYESAKKEAIKAERMDRADRPLLGIPIAVKDLEITKGMRTTFGSPIYKDFVPQSDSLLVKKIRSMGMIIVGKTNVSEFGCGSHTFNRVFPTTKNPYDVTKTAGGSSGGSGVAVAMRMAPIATGSDMGGSIRNPAAWNNVFGLRPTLGRLKNYPYFLAYTNFETFGPITKNPLDTAVFLQALEGKETGSKTLENTLNRSFDKAKVALALTLDDRAVSKDVEDVLRVAFKNLESLGVSTKYDAPSAKEADLAFLTLRAYLFSYIHRNHANNHKALLKDTLISDINRGASLSATALAEAEEARFRVTRRFERLLDNYNFLCMPTTSLSPFDINLEYPKQNANIEYKNYTDWMWPCYVVSLTGLPAASVPAGFDKNGLPVGMQIVGRRGDDLGVLQFANAFVNKYPYHELGFELARRSLEVAN